MNRKKLLKQFGVMIPVLDHGHVRLVDVMGDDEAIVQAARVSYGKGHSEHKWGEGFEGHRTCTVCGQPQSSTDEALDHCAKGDRKLIRYLMSHRHTTPFEMDEIKLHCKMPIFVARQWIRHRTANVNEVSGRYTMLPDEYYVPELSRVGGKGKVNKQGTEGELGAVGMNAQQFIDWIDRRYGELRETYEAADAAGISNELARLNTGVSQYTEWYWKIDLHNLLHFLELRLHEHAQYETRMYANAISTIVKAWVPFAWEAFVDYRLEAVTLSRMEAQALRAMMQQWGHEGGAPTLAWVQIFMDDAKLEGKGDRGEFLRKLGVIT